MPTRWMWWLGLVVVVAAPACGSSAAFMPATPVADVCGMVALSDVQVLLPAAPAGTALPPDDNGDVWMRGCAWQTWGLSVSLIVQGALTSNGKLTIDFAVEITSNSTTQATPVPGLGDAAVYLDNQPLNDQILNARKGSQLVSVAAYSYSSPVPESSLQPLVVEALGKL
jgi:hypothetical protein